MTRRGLANVELTSCATRATERFCGNFAELYAMQDYDKLAESFVVTYPQLCFGRTLFMIDCRPFRDPDNDKTLRRHVEFHTYSSQCNECR